MHALRERPTDPASSEGKGGDVITKKGEGAIFNRLKTVVTVGKGGVGAGMRGEIKRQAEAQEYFKIKVLKSSPEGIEEVAKIVEEEGWGTLLSIRGRVGLFKSKIHHPTGPPN